MSKTLKIRSITRIAITLTDEYVVVIEGKTKEEASNKIFITFPNHTGTFDTKTNKLIMANISKFSWDDFPNGLSLESIIDNEKAGIKQKFETPYREYEVKVTVHEDEFDRLIADGVKEGNTWCPDYMCQSDS